VASLGNLLASVGQLIGTPLSKEDKNMMSIESPRIGTISPTNQRTVRRKAFLVTNAKAGSGDNPPDVFDEFETLELNAVAAKVADEPNGTVIAVWGGDGTCRAVAQRTVNTDVALLPAPGGTFNHFAKQAGFVTVKDVEAAVESFATRHVDIADVNDEVFLNNASIGWYVDLLTRRQRYERHMPRRAAKLFSLAMQLFRTRRLRIQIDGVDERIWMLWVGNGVYFSESGAMPQRKALDDGVLDVRILRSGARLPKANALFAMVRKNAPSSSLVEIRHVGACQVAFRPKSIRLALDGELVTMSGPLKFQCRPRALLLVTPTLRPS
jgi:diacylglycerol kinase family enzyme